MINAALCVIYYVLCIWRFLTNQITCEERNLFIFFLSVGKPFLNKNENILKIIAFLFGRCKHMPYIYNIIITQKGTTMKTFTTIQSTKITSKKLNTFCTIDKEKKDGTNRLFFAVRNEEGKNIVSTMFARKYDAEKIVTKWFNHLATK